MKAYERLLSYVSYPTMSDENSDTVPSTKKQLVLAILFLALYAILGLLGVFEIVANIFS